MDPCFKRITLGRNISRFHYHVILNAQEDLQFHYLETLNAQEGLLQSNQSHQGIPSFNKLGKISGIAKLSPSFSFSWAELAIFPANPATHPGKYFPSLTWSRPQKQSCQFLCVCPKKSFKP